MISYWLDKVLGANDDGNNLTKLAPLVIFFVIWLFGAIAKAAQKGKKGTEEEPAKGQEKQHKPGFDGLAKKIRERYAQAQKKTGRAAQDRENEQFQPPARVSQPKPPPPRRPVPIPAEPIAPPVYSQEGPTLKVVKGLEQTNVGTHLSIEKPRMQKVESALNAKASGEVEIHHQHPYLAELAKQYATRDGFRRAILNYEILGPPLALRDYVYCGATEAR